MKTQINYVQRKKLKRVGFPHIYHFNIKCNSKIYNIGKYNKIQPNNNNNDNKKILDVSSIL